MTKSSNWLLHLLWMIWDLVFVEKKNWILYEVCFCGMSQHKFFSIFTVSAFLSSLIIILFYYKILFVLVWGPLRILLKESSSSPSSPAARFCSCWVERFFTIIREKYLMKSEQTHKKKDHIEKVNLSHKYLPLRSRNVHTFYIHTKWCTHTTERDRER